MAEEADGLREALFGIRAPVCDHGGHFIVVVGATSTAEHGPLHANVPVAHFLPSCCSSLFYGGLPELHHALNMPNCIEVSLCGGIGASQEPAA